MNAGLVEALALVGGVVGGGFAAAPGNVISTVGMESFHAKALIQATFRWDPWSVDVGSRGNP